MMAIGKSESLGKARGLMDDFVRRTGLEGNKGDLAQRYLWTDAFAVQTLFGLAHALEDDAYSKYAVKLVDVVHENLGRYRPDDVRKGWISGLPEAEGWKHPTAGGLRIGKRLPERKADEPFDEQLEWERDGQYFHYITRWVNALLQVQQETGEQRYADWAAELTQAGGRFIDKSGSRLRMYWKMSIDLSRPLVPSMGAHDPLEGLICAESALETAPHKAPELKPLISDFEEICSGQDWSTADALGIGGLLLNTLRASELSTTKNTMPEAIRPEKLWADSFNGLKVYARMHKAEGPASQRLAFRECGLSLGLRALSGLKEQLAALGLNLEELEKFIPLAESIEGFWSKPENQRAATWTEHLDINAVTLAASMVANHYPFAFCAIQKTR
ncbi:hypothetical protein DXT99_15450 [Pontibacter diazotrophicus]|uniref:Uncharacterized protein n=1 Tax=Pontibacter diazotrophicus TaxID=1400979 RepID=A0A3D8LA41_9BACT|nr:hypothetical protein [Pontibacter diazotrophicus]RDV14186.1 hypothetical protein DXT99_15450 [Pontibacter diazotrophicus]